MNLGFMTEMHLTSARDAFILDCTAANLTPKTLRGYRDVTNENNELQIALPRQAPKAGVLPLHHAPVRGRLYHSDG